MTKFKTEITNWKKEKLSKTMAEIKELLGNDFEDIKPLILSLIYEAGGDISLIE
jgi:hypothetical protein